MNLEAKAIETAEHLLKQLKAEYLRKRGWTIGRVYCSFPGKFNYLNVHEAYFHQRRDDKHEPTPNN